MDILILKHLLVRHFGGPKPQGHETKGHTHLRDHVTFLWGRHRVVVESAVLDGEGKQMVGPEGPVWKLKADVEMAGDGSLAGSVVVVDKGDRHNLISLDANGSHMCAFFHEDHEGNVVEEYRGFLNATQ